MPAGKIALETGAAPFARGDLDVDRAFVVSMVWGKSYLFLAQTAAERGRWVDHIQVREPSCFSRCLHSRVCLRMLHAPKDLHRSVLSLSFYVSTLPVALE